MCKENDACWFYKLNMLGKLTKIFYYIIGIILKKDVYLQSEK